MVKIFIVLLLTAFYSTAHAVEYTWHYAPEGGPGVYETCQAFRTDPLFAGCETATTGQFNGCASTGYRAAVKEYNESIVHIVTHYFYTCPDGDPDPPPPQDCSAEAGKSTTIIGSGGLGSCSPHIDIAGCGYAQGGVSAEMSDGTTACGYTGTGLESSAGAGDGSTATPTPPGGSCISGGGKQICYTPTGVNQGTINGEYVDLGKIGDTGIKFLPGGSVLTGANGPIPTNADGTPRDPDAVIGSVDADGNPVTSNYYQNGTGVLSGSTADAATAGATSESASLLADIKAGQCGGPGQPVCKVESEPEEEPSTAVPIGDAYTPGDETYSTVLDRFVGRMNNSTVISAGSSFFTVSLSGSCPIWYLPAVWVFPSYAIDMQCSSTMETMWPIISSILIATAGFIAFRWAFL